VAVGIFPVGIDFASVDEMRHRPTVQARAAELRALFVSKKVVLGRDKLDYIGGVPHKLMAFERFLQEHPQWRDKVRPGSPPAAGVARGPR
jgi:trehalose-6-phosphate synthase